MSAMLTHADGMLQRVKNIRKMAGMMRSRLTVLPLRKRSRLRSHAGLAGCGRLPGSNPRATRRHRQLSSQLGGSPAARLQPAHSRRPLSALTMMMPLVLLLALSYSPHATTITTCYRHSDGAAK